MLPNYKNWRICLRQYRKHPFGIVLNVSSVDERSPFQEYVYLHLHRVAANQNKWDHRKGYERVLVSTNPWNRIRIIGAVLEKIDILYLGAHLKGPYFWRLKVYINAAPTYGL
jgi:hypothetical protein